MSSTRGKTGWFADTSDQAPKAWPWQPCLQAAEGICLSIDNWFSTKDECETFIREIILGNGMYDQQAGA